MFKSYEDVVAFGNANTEALVASNKAAFAGAQEFSKVSVDLAKANVTRAVAVSKELAGLKKPEDFFQAQMALATEAVSKVIADGELLAAIVTKTTEAVSAPLVARVNALTPKAA